MTGAVNLTAVNSRVSRSTGQINCSRSLAFLIPLIIAFYWPLYSLAPELAIALFRPAVIGLTMLLALFSYRARLTSAEAKLAGLFAILVLALLVPTMTATDPARAFMDWVKLVILCGMSLLLCRALRDPSTAKAFGLSLVVASVIIAALIIFTYLRRMGFVIPTYTTARAFKGLAQKDRVPLNTVPFAAIFSYIAGMCLLRRNWALWSLGVALFVICSVLTGSRAPIGVLLACGLAILLLKAVRSPRLATRVTAYLAIVSIALSIGIVLFSLPFKQLSSMTEGRWDLWSVATAKFIERPILGYGYESWRDDLVSRLPGEYKLTGTLALTIAGGYHNEYLTLLAEQGLVGFFPALALVWFVLHSTWRLGYRKWRTWGGGQWAFFGCLFLIIRANVEVPGLFGYGQEPADYLAYIFLAIVISRLSVEEDYTRCISRGTTDSRLPARLGARAIGMHPEFAYRDLRL
jgi:O-antigen ligase